MILLSASLFFLLSLVAGAPQVQLGNTTVIGRSIPLLQQAALEQDFFGGIPFAEPPVGRLRLRPPILKTSLDASTFEAQNFGLECLQPGGTTDTSSEDCLTINVLRPSGLTPTAGLPVMAWIYGGGFFAGTASIYNGSAIVAHSVARGTPVIYVNFNYRLGPLGFPQGQEAADRKALNLGLKDQLAALEWIQHNIGAFGGDKTKVTVFGESAGAISIAILFLNSNLANLARAAIMESGSAGTTLTFDAARREVDWQHFVTDIPDCANTTETLKTFECLQTTNITSSALLEAVDLSLSQANEQFPWPPTFDGPDGLFPSPPSELFKKGQFARIPFIAGTNLDEGTLFTPTTVNSTEQIRLAIVANFSPPAVGPGVLESTAERLLELYPDDPSLGSPFNTGNETFGLSSQYKRAAALNDDISFQSQRRFWIQTASNAGVKTFGYLFTDPQTTSDPALGVFHSSEILYVYGGVTTTASAIALSNIMVDYWVSFATSLDPNDGLGSARPDWPQYTPQNQVLIQLNGANTTIIPDNYRAEQISFINADPLVFNHKRGLIF